MASPLGKKARAMQACSYGTWAVVGVRRAHVTCKLSRCRLGEFPALHSPRGDSALPPTRCKHHIVFNKSSNVCYLCSLQLCINYHKRVWQTCSFGRRDTATVVRTIMVGFQVHTTCCGAYNMLWYVAPAQQVVCNLHLCAPKLVSSYKAESTQVRLRTTCWAGATYHSMVHAHGTQLRTKQLHLQLLLPAA